MDFPPPTVLEGLDLTAIREAISPHFNKTTFLSSERLDAELGAKITIASESFQHTGSFKLRAALSVALHATESHLVTASSGNFGAALARAAKLAGKKCTVVMPASSSKVKIAQVKSYDAAVDLIDPTKVSRAARLAELAASIPDARSCSPYDDAYVIAGNATLGHEIFSALDPDVVVAPVGGGGLSSGIVVARDDAKAKAVVVGAEPAIANDAARSLRAKKRIANEQEPQTIADGARTLSLGEKNFAILERGMQGVVEVPEARIREAVRALFSILHLQVEPTGALAVAAVMTNPAEFSGKRVVCVVSGANVEPALYASILTTS
ncbi:MAG TPA: pyridoxal-phosphate dependent enzyme [Polyangiaceae bacterium]